MNDLILQYVVPFGTIFIAAMALTEWLTIPIGTVSVVPNRGTRKRWNSVIYSWLLAIVGWHAHLIVLPTEVWWQAYMGAGLLSIVIASASGVLVALKKGMLPEEITMPQQQRPPREPPETK